MIRDWFWSVVTGFGVEHVFGIILLCVGFWEILWIYFNALKCDHI